MSDDDLRYLTSREEAALSEFVARLRERYADEIVLVVLFGSKVRGDFDEESDLDVLVVVEGDNRWPYWRAITDLTSDLLLDYEVNVSALVFDEERYQWLMEHRTPIYNNTTSARGRKSFVGSRSPGIARSRPCATKIGYEVEKNGALDGDLTIPLEQITTEGFPPRCTREGVPIWMKKRDESSF